MPIYEFQCQACGTEIEVLQKINDPHITDCEVCGKAEMKKQVTAAAFRLSGAGWYETDFKNDSDKKKNLTEAVKDSPSKDKDQKPDDAKDTKKEAKVDSNKETDKASTKAESSPKETSKSKKDKPLAD